MTHSSWLPLKVDSPAHKVNRKLFKQKKPTVFYHLRDLHWLDEVSKHFPKQCAGGQIPWSPTRKAEGEAEHAPRPFVAEVHPACGTLIAGDLSKIEKLRKIHPYMEVSFSGPSFFIGCLLCALSLTCVLQQVLPTPLWFLRAGEGWGLPPASIPATEPLGQAKAPLDST